MDRIEATTCEAKRYVPQVGASKNEATHVATVTRRVPAELQRHVMPNAMIHGDKCDTFHDLIEAFFGADEDETLDNATRAAWR